MSTIHTETFQSQATVKENIMSEVTRSYKEHVGDNKTHSKLKYRLQLPTLFSRNFVIWKISGAVHKHVRFPLVYNSKPHPLIYRMQCL